MWSIHTTEHYSAFKRKEILTHVTTRVNLEHIVLSEVNQTQKDEHYMVSFLHKMSGKGKSTETESKMVAARIGGRED